MWRSLITLGAACAATLAVVATAAAAGPILASGPSPFTGCTLDNVAAQQQAGSILFMNAEPEMRSTINPTNASNIVGAYQQDRWNDGGARGLVSSWTKNGGQTWHPVVIPGITKCSGGIYDRASDPWVSFAPNGDLYSLSLSFDAFDTHNAIIVNKSTNGGESWGPALEVTADDTNGLDKQAITADPYDSNLVYAVWDRFLSPPGINASDQGKFHAASYVEQTWFSRTTNGGQSWEPARVAFNPGTHAGTIGNIVVVLPNATHDLLDGMILFADHKSQLRGAQIAVVRSSDHGLTWSKKATVIGQIDASFQGATDPDNGHLIRGGDLPDFAVDPHNGNVYAAWDDDSLNGIDSIFFSQSTDGGFNWSPPIKVNQTPTNIPAGDQQAFTAGGAGRGERHGRRHLLRPPRQHVGARAADELLARSLQRELRELRELGERDARGRPVRPRAGGGRTRLLRRRLRRADDERQRVPAVLRDGGRPGHQPERRLLRDGPVKRTLGR